MFINSYQLTVYEDFNMEEAFEKAVEELKRVDHLFYVSLKYTRTVDVIKNVMQRIINCIDFCFDSILLYEKGKGNVTDVPMNPGLKAELVKKTFSKEPEIVDSVNFYVRLRKLVRAEHTKREEFRRHVTMIATINKGEVVEVDIDLLKVYYDRTREFVGFVKRKILEEEQD